ncbi:uncharacterized protein K460DRAFT_405322 [Cucurbitaria berberidis CBS 394.84]|uniref:Mid2 domain-containing protein n=1 Tax=Cucurbitaria berberidis CBS 394.84 TaxID=1168544 RepID=A0A9P4GFD8_9PLEO|nr:uncharacterized protein K460DRAFT_405322 [Cucurbitaria berberidis CBS 394.84]KAF1845043.1 hypothetical protein K460DRAFT_405322 [Cucurbitaria berberidis CBS 394.84]
MAPQYYLYNNYSNLCLSTDSLPFNFGLRARLYENPLPFTFTLIFSTEYFDICTVSASNHYCLDVYPVRMDDVQDIAYLAMPNDTTGQQWKLESTEITSLLYRLSNKLSERGMYLDVYNQTKDVYMTDSDRPGHYWMKVKDCAVAPSDGSMSGNSPNTTLSDTVPPTISRSARPTQTVSTNSSLPTPVLASYSRGLSKGAKAGTGVGCALLAILVAGLVAALFYWRKKASKNVQATPTTRVEEDFGASEKYGRDEAPAELPSEDVISPMHSPSMGELPAQLEVQEMPGCSIPHS